MSRIYGFFQHYQRRFGFVQFGKKSKRATMLHGRISRIKLLVTHYNLRTNLEHMSKNAVVFR